MVKPEEMFPVMEDGKYVDKLRPQRNVQSVNALKSSNEHSAKQKRQQNELKEKSRQQLKQNAEKHRRRLNESGARLKQKSKPE